MTEYFTEPKFLGGRVKVELDLTNYATKSDFIKIMTLVAIHQNLLKRLVYQA